jgi:hypothetical protein
MSDLVSWLTQQIDYDEQVAGAATAGPWATEGNGSIVGPTGPLPKLAGHVVCSVGAWNVGRPTAADAAHIAVHDPAWVLRQVAAYRRILVRHQQYNGPVACEYCVGPDGEYVTWPCPDVRDLASIYSERPGFDPSWTVE